MRFTPLAVVVFVLGLGVAVFAGSARHVRPAPARVAPAPASVDEVADDPADTADNDDDDGSAAGRLVAAWSNGAESFTVGEGGAILHSSDGGKSFFVEKSGSEADLRAVWGASASDVFAVGEGGTVVHQEAPGVWRVLRSGVEEDLNAVWGRDGRDVFVVGDGGVVLHSTDHGQSWQRIDCRTDADLQAVSFTPSHPLLVVGDDATIRTIDLASRNTAPRCSGPTA